MTRLTAKTIKTLSLFSGAGGLDIGFHRAGFEIVACVEIESAYCATLQANIGPRGFLGNRTRVLCEDIYDLDISQFEGQGIECIIGGPPCQTFSAAGRRSGGVVGIRDRRGQLFRRYCEVLERIKPRAFIFENVYGLTGANGGASWRAIASAFAELGYILRCEVLDSADYGVPQHRERLILVGSREREFQFPMPTHGPDSETGLSLVSVNEAISDLQDRREPYHKGIGGLYGHLLPEVPEGLNYAFFTAEMGHPQPQFAWRSKFHDLLYKVDRNQPCRTIKAQPGKFTGPFHWKNRHFTAAELKRLQTFPDAYEIRGSFGTVVAQIGNSVPPKLAYVLAMSIREQLLASPMRQLTFKVRPFGFQSTFRQRQRERTHHFKKVAVKHISQRYSRKSKQSAADKPAIEQRFFVNAADVVRREQQTGRPIKQIAAQTFRVSITEKDGGLDLKVSNLKKADRSFCGEIGIRGLSKYLGRIDSVRCSFYVRAAEELFCVWREIEYALTSRSEFFSLIDIYGHYANRGDTIRISTNLQPGGCSEVIASALQYFGSSAHCGEFVTTEGLTQALKAPRAQLDDLVSTMRQMRFDVRTHETHPIIEEGSVLCTYPFPLLSAKAMIESKVRLIHKRVEEPSSEYLVPAA